MRGFLAIILLTVCCAGVSCRNEQHKGISIDAAFQSLVPPNARALAGLRLNRIESTPLFQRHQEILRVSQLEAWLERLGVDSFRDLSELLFVWTGEASIIAARGHFVPERIQQKAAAMGGKADSYKRHTMINAGANAVAFLSNELIVAGKPEAVRTSIDLMDSRKGSVPAEFGAQLQALSDADQIWAVMRGGVPVSDLPLRSDVESMLSNVAAYITHVTFGTSLNSGANVQLDLACVSEAGARRVRDGLKAGIGLARLTTKDNELDLLRLYDAIRIDQPDTSVHVRADINAALADKLLAYIPQANERNGSALKSR
jgi:hypothetical protein